MNPNKRTNLPVTLTRAVAMYYANRACSEHQMWDKEDDLNKINKVATKLGLSFSACAGTFWFKRKKDKSTLKVDESTFPFATRCKVLVLTNNK